MKILVVEDDKFYAQIYRTRFGKIGYDVDWAKNGQEAIEKLKSNRPDLVILDLIMPVKDGFETLAEIKSNEKLKGLKILIVSNLGQEEDVKRAMLLGATHYLVKVNTSLHDVEEAAVKILEGRQ